MPISIDNVDAIGQQQITDVVREGSITLGDKTYSVTVNDDDTVTVRRQGLGNMSTIKRIGNAIKDFFGRLFGEGALSTRANRLETRLQGMLRYHRDFQNARQQALTTFNNSLDEALRLSGHSLANHTETCVQTMSDDKEVQQFLRENLDSPDYSSDTFTGIEDHPTDGSKFIAKFGDKELVFSNRGGRTEYRGTILKEELRSGNYTNLGELIGRSYLSTKDPVFIYGSTPAKDRFDQALRDMEPGVRNQLIDSLRHQPIGNTTFGQIYDSIRRG